MQYRSRSFWWYIIGVVVAVVILATIFHFLSLIQYGWILIALVIILVIRYTSVIQAYFAPSISKQFAKFTVEYNHQPVEVIIEQVILTSSRTTTAVTKVLRLSVYNTVTQKRLQRYLLGDDAQWVGDYNNVLWFYNPSRFFQRRTGLLGYSLKTLSLNHHLPAKFPVAKKLTLDDIKNYL